MQLTQLAMLVVAAATSVQGAAIPAELEQRDPLFGSLSFSGSFDADWNSLYRLAGHQNVYDMCCQVIKPKTSTIYETKTVTVPVVVHATATATTTAIVHKQTTITQHVRSTKTVATEYQTSTATVTAAAQHKRFFNLLWNSFFQKLYLKDAALTEIKCAALGYKPSVVYVHVPKTETCYETQTNFVATNTKTETKTIVEPTTTTLVEHVPATATVKVTVTTTVPAAVPTKAPVPSYPTCSGSGSTGTSWALYTGVSYSLDSFHSFGCGDVQTCTNECNNSWSKHGKECAGIQWNPTSKLCSLKGEASTSAKFSFGFDFSSSLFLVKNKDCQSNSVFAPAQGNDCCCNYKA